MRIVGVVDLMGGQAVHARAGRRDQYAPVEHVAGRSFAPGDALSLAREYVDTLRVDDLYVADLDAIVTGRAPSPVIETLAALGVPLWLDAGVSSVNAAARALDAGATRVIIGLETLSSIDILGRISESVGGQRIAFSLDLRNGEPITVESAAHRNMSADAIARAAADAGVRAMTIIDLARVGIGDGPDLAAISRIRDAVPGVLLLAGGGVRGEDDLARLAAAGCDGALVASALHDGRLSGHQVAAAKGLHRSVSR
jgi:phosphoribosylformimino-5-aminoimidazole carboxamide ribotide isomerase